MTQGRKKDKYLGVQDMPSQPGGNCARTVPEPGTNRPKSNQLESRIFLCFVGFRCMVLAGVYPYIALLIRGSRVRITPGAPLFFPHSSTLRQQFPPAVPSSFSAS